jgi:hypothetical protein
MRRGGSFTAGAAALAAPFFVTGTAFFVTRADFLAPGVTFFFSTVAAFFFPTGVTFFFNTVTAFFFATGVAFLVTGVAFFFSTVAALFFCTVTALFFGAGAFRVGFTDRVWRFAAAPADRGRAFAADFAGGAAFRFTGFAARVGLADLR